MIHKSAAIMLVLLAAGLINSCNLNEEWDKYYENAPDRTGENVLSVIAENENYSNFYNALIENGFETMLSKNQYFTYLCQSIRPSMDCRPIPMRNGTGYLVSISFIPSSLSYEFARSGPADHHGKVSQYGKGFRE